MQLGDILEQLETRQVSKTLPQTLLETLRETTAVPSHNSPRGPNIPDDAAPLYLLNLCVIDGTGC
jgi:hypothetical protein